MKTVIDRAEIYRAVARLDRATRVADPATKNAVRKVSVLIHELAQAPTLLAQTNHAATCIYCGEAVIYDTRAEADMQAAHQRLIDHDQHCPRNPLVARVAELEDQVEALEAQAERAHSEVES